MTPGGTKEPSGDLKSAIDNTFGSVSTMSDKVNAAGVARFGSGWAWLVVNRDKKLDVISTANQDTPLELGARAYPRRRRLGTCLLPQIPEPAGRLSEGLVEHSELDESQRKFQESNRLTFALSQKCRVCFWHKADIPRLSSDVRAFWG